MTARCSPASHALDTDGIKLTPRAVNQIVYGSPAHGLAILPHALRVARAELEPDAAAEQAEAAWHAFVEFAG